MTPWREVVRRWKDETYCSYSNRLSSTPEIFRRSSTFGLLLLEVDLGSRVDCRSTKSVSKMTTTSAFYESLDSSGALRSHQTIYLNLFTEAYLLRNVSLRVSTFLRFLSPSATPFFSTHPRSRTDDLVPRQELRGLADSTVSPRRGSNSSLPPFPSFFSPLVFSCTV